MESPTNRTPSGPNAKAPADFRSAFPAFKLSVRSAVTPAVVSSVRARTAQIAIRNVAMVSPFLFLKAVRYFVPDLTLGSSKRAIGGVVITARDLRLRDSGWMQARVVADVVNDVSRG